MNPHTLAEYARDIAFVTIAMSEELERIHEEMFPNCDRERIFNGFMGFASHAGAAGLVLAKACDGLVSDAWIDIVDDFAGRVVRHAIRTGTPASAAELRRFALQARSLSAAEGGAP
ncbi:MAG: hypothetical protein AB7E80_16405 [Hyphomicrobiaceae bacterium]